MGCGASAAASTANDNESEIVFEAAQVCFDGMRQGAELDDCLLCMQGLTPEMKARVRVLCQNHGNESGQNVQDYTEKRDSVDGNKDGRRNSGRGSPRSPSSRDVGRGSRHSPRGGSGRGSPRDSGGGEGGSPRSPTSPGGQDGRRSSAAGTIDIWHRTSGRRDSGRGNRERSGSTHSGRERSGSTHSSHNGPNRSGSWHQPDRKTHRRCSDIQPASRRPRRVGVAMCIACCNRQVPDDLTHSTQYAYQ